jgi:hypothetical protein
MLSSKKNGSVKGLCGSYLSVWANPPPFTLCILVYSTHREGERGRLEPERRERGNSSPSWFKNTNVTDCISSL